MRHAARYLPLAIAIALSGCVTPSIPIPPPDADRMDFGIDATAGTATFAYAGDANFAGAIVYVLNRDTGMGVIDMADGNGAVGPTAAFPAMLGDEIAVTFETEDDIVSTCVILREGRPDGTQVCSR